jgi:hypothetical protein
MGRKLRRRDPQDSLLFLYAHDATVRRTPTQISAAHAKTLLFDVPFVIVQFADYLLFAILVIMVDMLSISNLGLRSMTNAQLVVAAAVLLLRTCRKLMLSNSSLEKYRACVVVEESKWKYLRSRSFCIGEMMLLI